MLQLKEKDSVALLRHYGRHTVAMSKLPMEFPTIKIAQSSWIINFQIKNLGMHLYILQL